MFTRLASVTSRLRSAIVATQRCCALSHLGPANSSPINHGYGCRRTQASPWGPTEHLPGQSGFRSMHASFYGTYRYATFLTGTSSSGVGSGGNSSSGRDGISAWLCARTSPVLLSASQKRFKSYSGGVRVKYFGSSTNAGDEMESYALDMALDRDTALLLRERFSNDQAAKILSFFLSQKRVFHLNHMQQWLELLRKHHVEDPQGVVSRHPIILLSKVETAEVTADAVSQWLASLGLSQAQIADVFGRRPMFMVIPHATAAATSEWLISELGWSGGMIASVAVRYSSIFGRNAAESLQPKVAWFKSVGFSTAAVSKAVHCKPNLLSYAITHYNAQMLALQAIGLSQAQVLEIVQKMPVLLTHNLPGSIMQSKVNFLTTVMKKQVQELIACPVYFNLSLMERIGPRWFFYSCYCSGQAFVLRTNLVPTDAGFVARLASPPLDAECADKDLSRLEVYTEFKSKCKEVQLREWNVSKAEQMQ